MRWSALARSNRFFAARTRIGLRLTLLLLGALFGVSVIGCTPVQVRPTQGEVLTMYQASSVPELAISADTFVMTAVGEGDTPPVPVLGRNSTFEDLPSNSIVLLGQGQEPAGAKSLGTVYLNSELELPFDRVMILPSTVVTEMLTYPSSGGIEFQLSLTTTAQLNNNTADPSLVNPLGMPQLTLPINLSLDGQQGSVSECVEWWQCICLSILGCPFETVPD